MKKLCSVIGVILLGLSLPVIVNASMLEYASGGYSTPSGYTTIASKAPADLHHSYYHTWGLNDLSYPLKTGSSINIVFHDVYNWAVESNWLNVYLFDNVATGWTTYYDGQNPALPNWNSANLLGVWSDTDGDATTNDVVFSTSDSTLLSYLTNGGTFGFGIDPDCHFYGSKISVEAPAPVPEPATMLLFGVGLIGFAGFRKKFKKI